MDLNILRTFVSVVQKQSMSEAADSLGYAKATVSVQMASLQKEFGCQIFMRSGRSFTLSKEGEKLYLHALTILNEYEEARADLLPDSALQETLNIGIIESLYDSSLAHQVSAFGKQYPGIRIRMFSDTIDALIHMLDTHRIDLAVMVDVPIYDARFETVLLSKEQVHFVCHNSHPVSDITCLRDLLHVPLLLTEKNASYRQLLDHCCGEKGIVLEPVIESANTGFLMSMLMERDGISFLPDYVIQRHPCHSQFAMFSIQEVDITLDRQILMNRTYQSRSTRLFVQMLK